MLQFLRDRFKIVIVLSNKREEDNNWRGLMAQYVLTQTPKVYGSSQILPDAINLSGKRTGGNYGRNRKLFN